MKWLCGVLVAMCGMSASLLAQTKVVLIGGTAYVDAVKSLGCTPGIGNGSGNAAKINAYLASRPKYPLFIPGGALEIDDTIVLPAQKGVSGIFGNSQGGDLNDNSYTGGTQGGQPTRLVWAGAENKAMIQVDSLFARIEGLSLQARRQPNAEPNNTGVKARIGIHVRTFNDTGTPTGKGKFRDLTFYGIPNGILFGHDLDTPLTTVANGEEVGKHDNSDESSMQNLHYFFPYNAGEGTGSLTTRTSDTAGVITLGSSSHGISQGSPVNIAWSGGARTGMYVTSVSGAAVTVSGGAGDNLPGQSTSITSCFEERCALRFRSHQAVGFDVGFCNINGNPREVFYFERGGKLRAGLISLVGWKGSPRTMNLLRLGGVFPGGYDITTQIDAATTNFKLLQCDEYLTSTCFVNFTVFNSDPANPPGAYTLPLLTARGSCAVRINGMRSIPDGAFQLIGSPGSGGARQRVAGLHLYECAAVGADWPDDLLAGTSSGPRHFTWTNLKKMYDGPSDNTGFESRPYEDGEVLTGPIPTVTKITGP